MVVFENPGWSLKTYSRRNDISVRPWLSPNQSGCMDVESTTMCHSNIDDQTAVRSPRPLAQLDPSGCRDLADPQQPRPLRAQPRDSGLRVRRQPIHQRPEIRTVIHVAQMRDLVRNDIV